MWIMVCRNWIGVLVINQSIQYRLKIHKVFKCSLKCEYWASKITLLRCTRFNCYKELYSEKLRSLKSNFCWQNFWFLQFSMNIKKKFNTTIIRDIKFLCIGKHFRFAIYLFYIFRILVHNHYNLFRVSLHEN